MTDRFNKFLPFIFKWETEYNRDGSVRTEHDPDDPGGTTKFGIDQRSHPDIDIENLSLVAATEIYSDEWDRASCEAMAPKLGEVYFNAWVNTGPGRADKLFAVANGDPTAFIDAQAAFYSRLAAARPSSQKYLKGWLNRLNDLRHYLGLNGEAEG